MAEKIKNRSALLTSGDVESRRIVLDITEKRSSVSTPEHASKASCTGTARSCGSVRKPGI